MHLFKVMAVVLTLGAAPAAFADPAPGTLEWAASEHARGTQLFEAQDFVGAEAAYRAALQVRTREAAPQEWAESIAGAGAAQSFRGIRTREATLLNGAIRDYRAALEIYSRVETPDDWAKTENNLATALVWLDQVQGVGGVETLQAAERSFQNVLEVVTPEARPADAGVVLYNIGTVQERLGDRMTGAAQLAQHRQASDTYARAIDTLRRGGAFPYASDVERRVSPFMNRVAARN